MKTREVRLQRPRQAMTQLLPRRHLTTAPQAAMSFRDILTKKMRLLRQLRRVCFPLLPTSLPIFYPLRFRSVPRSVLICCSTLLDTNCKRHFFRGRSEGSNDLRGTSKRGRLCSPDAEALAHTRSHFPLINLVDSDDLLSAIEARIGLQDQRLELQGQRIETLEAENMQHQTRKIEFERRIAELENQVEEIKGQSDILEEDMASAQVLTELYRIQRESG